MAKSLLFVCTFNAGRSAAAEHLVRRMLRQRDERLAREIEVSSAGLATRRAVQHLKDFGIALPRPFFGRPPHRYLRTLMSQRGIDTSEHRSRVLTRALLDEADLVIVFGEHHKEVILSLWPHAEGKVFTFQEFVSEQSILPEAANAEPIQDGDFVDYDVEQMAPFIADLERSLEQALDEFISYLQVSEAR